jgi:hypothetical protein
MNPLLIARPPYAGNMENSMKNTSNTSQILTSTPPVPLNTSPDAIPNGPQRAIVATDAVEGRPVVNAQEEYLGDVAHIMAVVPDGKIAYVVVSRGGGLGVGNQLHAIPWSALMFDEDNERFVLNSTEESLKNAPSFDKDNWPVMTDRDWGTAIHNYYGQRNYWHQPSSNQL